jgi:prepilin-type processing-associated H-X9-DG protein
MKQISLGLILYANDSKDWLPISLYEHPSANGGAWDWRARVYIGSAVRSNKFESVLHQCPSRVPTPYGTDYDQRIGNYSMLHYRNTPGSDEYGVWFKKDQGPLANFYSQNYAIAPPMRDFQRPSSSFVLYEVYYHEMWKGTLFSVINELRDSRNNIWPAFEWHDKLNSLNGAYADGHVAFVGVEDASGRIDPRTTAVYATGGAFSITGKK